jgi:hypothetical protein
LIFVFSSNKSPSVTTRLAIFPFSMEPTGRQPIDLGWRKGQRAQPASGANPASIDFFTALEDP